MKVNIVIEKQTEMDKKIMRVYNNAYPTLTTNGYTFNPDERRILVNHFSYHLPTLKVGTGGSHLWISNQLNERLAIIYFK